MAIRVSRPANPTIKQTIEIPQAESPAEQPERLTREEKEFEFFTEAQQQLMQDQRAVVYCKRRAPSLARIDVYRQSLQGDEEFNYRWVADHFGGSEWNLMLCGNQSGKIIRSIDIQIPDPPKNLNAKGETLPAGQMLAPTGNGDGSMIQLMREMLAENRQMMKEFVSAGRPPNQNPAVELSAMNGLVAMLAKQVPEAKSPLAILGDLKALMPAPVDMLKVLTEAKALFSSGVTGGGSLLGQVDELLGVAEKLGFKMGGGNGSHQGFWPTMAEKAVEHIPVALESLTKIADRWAAISQANALTAQYRATAARTPQPIQLPAPGPNAPPAPPSAPNPGALDVEPIAGQPANVVQDVPTELPPGAVLLDPVALVKSKIVEAIQRGGSPKNIAADIVAGIDFFDPQFGDTLSGISLSELEQFFTTDPILVHSTSMPAYQRTLQALVDLLQEEVEPEPEEEAEVANAGN